jgi:multisubunit Na+/H+ antiporter MnhB subunit
MGIVTVYILYLIVSVVLTIVTATILARSGKTFLTHMFRAHAADPGPGRTSTSPAPIG